MKNKIIISSTVALITTLLTAFVLAQDSDYLGCGMMSGFYGSYGGGIMYLSWITYILFIGLLVAGIYWLIKSANRKK